MLLISIVPIGLFAGGLLYLHWEAQERDRERSQLQLVRLLAAAVDTALDSTVERLSILARLGESTALNPEGIHGQLRSAVQANADWSDILAFRPDGTVVFRAASAGEAEKLPSPGPDIWRRVVSGKAPLVSDVLVPADGGGQPIVAVGVPVTRGGSVTQVLVATLDLTWYDRLLARQGLPEGGVAGLLDRSFKFVARSSEGNARRGSDPTEALVRDMKARREGVGRYVNLNGTAVYTAWGFTRHGWGVGIATPAGLIDRPFWGYLASFGFAWVVLVILGILHAFSKARGITASLESLEGQTRHLAAGQRIADLPASRVVEIDRALAALEEASARLQSATQERDHSLRTEHEARTAAESASRAKDEFLAMLGHELRNPLGAISNAVAIMGLEGRTEEHLATATRVIERQSQHLARLIDDLLDVGRVMTGKIVLARAPLDLADSVRHAVATLETAGRFADRHLELDLTPAWIDGDHTRIQQLVTNLLVNAATYTARGGHVRVRVFRESGGAVLRVSDDGRGIDRENLSRIFDLFFQADSTVDRSTGGLGIGLTLVQRLARLHGGDVKAESEGRGRGASFTVRLPAVAAPATRPRPAERDLAGEAKTVLIVEDNDDGRRSLRMALELWGHRVLEAVDGPAALDLLRSEQPTVAVLDIGLPGMDGYELARRLRATFGDQIGLIALTGYGMESDARRAMEAGFDRHLTKPVDLQGLAEAIDLTGRPSGAAPRG
jgi:signal transduction histidine kinase/CheY-like chemotaxis protein